MQQNEFLSEHFLSPQFCKDYRLPISEIKTVAKNQPEDSPEQQYAKTNKKDVSSSENNQLKVIKRNKRTPLGNYPSKEQQRKKLLSEVDKGIQLRKAGKIKANKIVKTIKESPHDSILKKSNTEPSEMLGEYLQYLKYRERIRLYSKSGVRKNSSHSAAHKIRKDSASLDLFHKIHSEPEVDKISSKVRFLHLRTQILRRRQNFQQVYYQSKKENKLLGTYEMRIPKIPLRQGLESFLVNYRPNSEQIKMSALLKANFSAVEYSDDELYIGQMIGKHKQGLGILITRNLCFQGLWKNNERVRGIQITKSGVYNGTFVANKREGHGQFHRHSGDIYVGQWKKGKKDGVGLWINGLGESYSGSWHDGKPEGNGVLTLKGRVYRGNFRHFKQNGYGRQRYPNGDTYQGFFKDDLPHGKGTYHWANGSVFEGNFLDGTRQGFGQIKVNNRIIYRGYFIRDRPEGECEILLKNNQSLRGIANPIIRERPYTKLQADQIQKKWYYDRNDQEYLQL